LVDGGSHAEDHRHLPRVVAALPAGSFAQDSKVNDGRMIEGTAATAVDGTLRESAVRQARLAVATDAAAQAPKSPSWPSRYPTGFGLWQALASAPG
jgi:hypothetical protein